MTAFTDLKAPTYLTELPDGFQADWGLRAIRAPEVWSAVRGKGVRVAILDTGIDPTHPDLTGRIHATLNAVHPGQEMVDDHGHGTMMAGLVAGPHTGAAPDAELVVAKILNQDGRGTLPQFDAGIRFAVQQQADVICLSLGAGMPNTPYLRRLMATLRQKNITVVSASGNNGWNRVAYPAFYADTLAVGGVTQGLERADFSNYGPELDLTAPAVDVLSTFPGGGYARMSGTSLAVPLVGGAVALLKEAHRLDGQPLTHTDLTNQLKRLGERKSLHLGWGVMDLTTLINRQEGRT